MLDTSNGSRSVSEDMARSMTGSRQKKNGKNPRVLASRAIVHAILLAGAVVMLVPFYWMLITSVKPPEDIYTLPLKWWPTRFVWSNYVDAWNSAPFARYFYNTIVVAVLSTGGTLVTSALAAYAFARMEFYGREAIFAIFLGTMMIPEQVTMIPNYITIFQLGWKDTYAGLVVPWIVSVFSIFLMRQFFMTIPRELEDAAAIDGCGRLGFLRQVVIPLSRPVFLTAGLFAFLGSWNAFLWPLIITDTPEMRTVQIGLATFSQEFGTEQALLMAASTFTIMPIVIIYFFVQKQFIQGIARSGLKA